MKTYNGIDMKGRLFAYDLKTRDLDKGTAITGNIELEVDTNGTIVKIEVFAMPTFSSGKRNSTYDILDDIMNGEIPTVKDNGDAAEWYSVTGDVNVSYGPDKRNSGEIIRYQKVRGRFLNPNKKHEYKNRWAIDMLITHVAENEEDPEKNTKRSASVCGYFIDDYNQRLMEVEFKALRPGAIEYFLGLPATYEAPYFVGLWGERIVAKTVSVKKNAIPGMDDEIRETTKPDWEITGVSPEPYTFGDADVISADTYEKFKKALQDHRAEAAAKKNALAEETDGDMTF